MAVIAVAGGTGKLGRAIVEALKANRGHTIKVLARKMNSGISEELGVQIVPANYSDVDSLKKLLEDNDIETIVSAMTIVDDDTSNSQLNLIAAADRSSCTKRFIPSEYGIPYTEEHAAVFPVVGGKLAAVEKLESTSLGFTLVSNGFFMDYYGLPRAKSYLQPLIFVVDMAHNTAAIPGSGDTPVVFTHTFDVAKFVAALVNQDVWPKRSIIVGDRMTWNQVLSIAEEVKGTKFTVAHDSKETLASFQVTELPSHPLLYQFVPKEQLQYFLAIFGRWTAGGEFDLPENDALNTRFPEIKTRTIREVMEEGWKV